jgi:hypothetical protein
MVELIQGRDLQLEPFIHDLWTQLFRVLDDMKVSILLKSEQFIHRKLFGSQH